LGRTGIVIRESAAIGLLDPLGILDLKAAASAALRILTFESAEHAK
jgi:hypothetical protein